MFAAVARRRVERLSRRILPCVRLLDRKSTRLNSSHGYISYAVFCLKKKKNTHRHTNHSTRHAHDEHTPPYVNCIQAVHQARAWKIVPHVHDVPSRLTPSHVTATRLS